MGLYGWVDGERSLASAPLIELGSWPSDMDGENSIPGSSLRRVCYLG